MHSFNRSIASRAAVVASLFAIGLSACGEATGPGTAPPATIAALPRTLTTLEQEAIRASNGFGLSLLREVASESAGKNVVLSPFSASVALGMAYAGSNGTTETAMRETLGWGARSRADILSGYRDLPGLILGLDPKVDIRSANALWVRNGFPVLASYTSEMQSVFSASVRNGAFDAATIAEMNAWASQSTNGRIPKVVESLDDDMVAMLMNALYFKASWRDRFDVAKTRSVPFSTSAGAQPSVATMFREDTMAYGVSRGAQVAELSYGNTAFVMTLVLPQAGTSPRQWLQGLDATAFSAALPTAERKVDLSLPKFRLAVDYQLADALSRMGMGIAFRAREANFTRIANAELFLTHVKQDVFIDVNEEGTEAAAVTQVGVGLVSAPVIPVMHLDRPFLFFIRERLSGTILFAGIIEQPSS